MWILPKQLHTLACALDTEALSLDLAEQSQICAQSLFVRSKHSPARTWLQKWKRDSWTALLSGRILKPSLGKSFVAEWSSLLPATHVNHLAQQGSEQDQTTQDTFGLSSQTEFDLCDPRSASLRTSKDTSRWDSPALSATWKNWVTKCRGEYSQRVKSAHLTNASESSSWPTMHMGSNERGAYYDKTGKGQRYLSDAVVDQQKNWPIPTVQEAGKIGNQPNHGLPAPASPSTDGSRQESWPTTRTMDGQIDESLESWDARAIRKKAQGINLHRPLPIAVKQEQKSWATPNAFDWNQPETREQWKKRAENQKQKGVNLHLPLKSQVTPNVLSAKLNPRWVETLMGLPVGWTMPSCASPVTIAQTSCDYSETELSQQQQSEHSELF